MGCWRLLGFGRYRGEGSESPDAPLTTRALCRVGQDKMIRRSADSDADRAKRSSVALVSKSKCKFENVKCKSAASVGP
jgi:hypothetical protein